MDRGRPVKAIPMLLGRTSIQQCWVRATSGMQQGPARKFCLDAMHPGIIWSSLGLSSLGRFFLLLLQFFLCDLSSHRWLSKSAGCGWCSEKHELAPCVSTLQARIRAGRRRQPGILAGPCCSIGTKASRACPPVFLLVHHVAATFIQLSRGLPVLI